MNKTSNYSLNQWERTDRVLMEDFNADNAKLDTALGALAKGKAEAAALTALAARVSAIEPLARENSVSGSFEGDQTVGKVVPLPWTPKLVILVGDVTARNCLGILTANFIMNIGIGVTSSVYTPGYGDYANFPSIQGSSIRFNSSHFNKGNTYYVAFR